MPVAIVATRYSSSYDLRARRVRDPRRDSPWRAHRRSRAGALRHDDLRLEQAGGRGTARIGRALGVLGIALGATALVAVGVYGLLTYLGER